MEKFVKEEIKRFMEKFVKEEMPFRVAIGGRGHGHYPYGSHTERRDYLDYTVAYCHSRDDAILALVEAWLLAEGWNKEALAIKWLDGLDLKTARRRVEDCIRKNPTALSEVLSILYDRKLIRTDGMH